MEVSYNVVGEEEFDRSGKRPSRVSCLAGSLVLFSTFALGVALVVCLVEIGIYNPIMGTKPSASDRTHNTDDPFAIERTRIQDRTSPLLLRVTENSTREGDKLYRTQYLTGDADKKGDFIQWNLMDGGVWVLELHHTWPKRGQRSYTQCPEDLQNSTGPRAFPGYDGCMTYIFETIVENELDEPVVLHWHGLTPPMGQDGVPFLTAPPINSKETVYFNFEQIAYPGAHFIHSHYGQQLARGMAVPVFLQHSDSYLKHDLRITNDVVALLEERFLYPDCAYSGHYLYKEECTEKLKVTPEDFGIGFWFLNRQEAPVVVISEPESNVRVRMINAGTEAPWNFTVNQKYSNIGPVEVIAIDGNDIERDGVTYQNFPVGTASRVDVLLRIPEGECTRHVLTFFQMMHRYGVTHPVARHLVLQVGNEDMCKNHWNVELDDLPNVGEVDQTKYGDDEGRFGMIYDKLTSVYPLRDLYKKPDAEFSLTNAGNFRMVEWKIVNYFEGGDQFGGFPLTLFKASHQQIRGVTELPLRKRKWQMPPFKAFVHKDNENDFVSTRRACKGCEKGPYGSTGILKVECEDGSLNCGTCCWEWCAKIVYDDTSEGLFRNSRCQKCVNEEMCEDYQLQEITKVQRSPDPMLVCFGWRVHITIRNVESYEELEGHPFHLHGHKFQVVALTDENQPNPVPRLVNGPVIDTVWIPYNTSITIAFDAWNPGRWIMHCHNHFHLENGMATSVEYHALGAKECKGHPQKYVDAHFSGNPGVFPRQYCAMAGCNVTN